MSKKLSKRVAILVGITLLILCIWEQNYSTSFGMTPRISPQTADSLVTKKYLEKELENIKRRQDIVLESVSNSYVRALWIFGIIGAIITIFSFFQTYNDTRIMRLLKGQIDESKNVTKSYQKNIDSISGLVGSMREAYDFRTKAQEMMEEIVDLKNRDDEQIKHWNDEIIELNKFAMGLSLKCKRHSYTQLSFQTSIKQFRDKYEIIKGSTDIDERLNANCYYMLALDYRISNDYDEALANFKLALENAEKHTTEEIDQKFLYPELPEGKTLSFWLSKLQNVCIYHSAIILYNLGEYGEALRRFELALEYDPKDYQALTYIPEVMFLGRLSSFRIIETKFNDVIEKIATLTPEETKNFTQTKEQLLAQIYMKFGNCYLGESNDEDYRSYKDLSIAEKHMQRAYELNAQSTIIKFSLAQVLYLKDQEDRSSGAELRLRYRDLFLDAFRNIKTQVGRITEEKILMMYYYILAICCQWGEIENEIPQLYIMRIYELRPKLPNYDNLRIFSPLTKNDLSVDEFIAEIEGFQTNIQEKTSTSSAEVAFQSRLPRSRRHLRT